MAKSLKIFRDFTGGLSEAAPDNVKDNELVIAQNVVPDVMGGATKAKGTKRVNALPYDANKVSLIVEHVTGAGVVTPLCFSGTTLRKWDGTVIKADLPAMPTDQVLYKNKLYWLDGVKYWQFDGTTVAEVTMNAGGDATVWALIKTCTFIEQRGQRFFFAKKGTNLVYFSEIGDPAYIKGTSELKTITADEDTITGLREFSDSILVFKRNSIFSCSGYDFASGSDITWKKLLVSKGAIAQKTIQIVENMLIFMADDGVYAITSPYPNLIQGANITENKIGKVIKAAINKEKAAAIYFDGSYRLSISTSGAENNQEYRYYPKLNAWYGPYTHPVSAYLVKNSDGKLYSGSPIEGLIFEHESTDSYDGQPIYYKIRTKPYDLAGLMVVDSKIKRFYLAARQYVIESSTLKVTITTDYKETAYNINLDESLVYAEGLWGETFWGWVDLITKEMKINSSKAKRATLTIENNEIDQPVTVYGFSVLYKQRKPKGARIGVIKIATN